MRFIARLCGVPDLERPLNCIGSSVQVLVIWAEGILTRQPDGASVEIFEMIEQHRVTISKEKTC